MYSQFIKLLRQSVFLCFAAALFSIAAAAQQTANGTIRGKIVDVQGALIGGASVTVVSSANGAEERTAQTNQDGLFSIGNLAAGRYTVRVLAPGFAIYENAEVNVAAGKTLTLDAALSITVNAEVNVGGEQAINTNPEANASAIVLNQEDIKALPDNPAELEAALQALAGPAAGPNSGGDDDDESPYKLELFVQIRNLFNRTNGGTPVGNLSSSLFGESVSLASGFGFGGGRQSGGNRRFRFEVQFSF